MSNAGQITLRDALANHPPHVLDLFDRLTAEEAHTVLTAAKAGASGQFLAQLMALISQYGPALASLVQALINIFKQPVASLILLAVLITAANAQPAKPVQFHQDAANQAVHQVGGLHPLKPGAFHDLQAEWHRKHPQPQPQPQPQPVITPIDNSGSLPAVLDQDGFNCCAGCAGSMAHRAAEILAGSGDPQDSVADLYDQCNSGVDQGADLQDITNALANVGVAAVDAVPAWQIPKATAGTLQQKERIVNKLEHWDFCPDEDTILTAVESGKPVLFGTVVTDRFQPDSQGNIGPYSGRQEGGHALLAIGVKATGTGHAYRVRNSWGEQWGDNGNCWLDSTWLMPATYGAFAYTGTSTHWTPTPPQPAPKTATVQDASTPYVTIVNGCQNGQCRQQPRPRSFHRRR